MASYSSSNTEPERWAKIVKEVDSGRYPNIMIDEEKLIAIPSAGDATVQSFLANVFKDGDNEWFHPASDSVKTSRGKAVEDGQPEGSKKKVSLTQQRAMARQAKKDKGQEIPRVERAKDSFEPADWEKVAGKVSTLRCPGVFLEKGKIVATGSTEFGAQKKLSEYIEIALNSTTSGRAKLMGNRREMQSR